MIKSVSARWRIYGKPNSSLAEAGVPLAFDVPFEDIGVSLALAVYGAGVTGRIDDELWDETATCSPLA